MILIGGMFLLLCAVVSGMFKLVIFICDKSKKENDDTPTW